MPVRGLGPMRSCAGAEPLDRTACMLMPNGRRDAKTTAALEQHWCSAAAMKLSLNPYTLET